MFFGTKITSLLGGRAPYGARGLKSQCLFGQGKGLKGRAPYGARGLKSCAIAQQTVAAGGRAPYGARGLKSAKARKFLACSSVAPRMGRVD